MNGYLFDNQFPNYNSIGNLISNNHAINVQKHKKKTTDRS